MSPKKPFRPPAPTRSSQLTIDTNNKSSQPKQITVEGLLQRAARQPGSLNATEVLQLQRVAGNSAVNLLLKGQHAAADNAVSQPAIQRRKQSDEAVAAATQKLLPLNGNVQDNQLTALFKGAYDNEDLDVLRRAYTNLTTVRANNGAYIASIQALADPMSDVDQAYSQKLVAIDWSGTPSAVAPILEISTKPPAAQYDPNTHKILVNPAALTGSAKILDMIMFEVGNALQQQSFQTMENNTNVAQNGPQWYGDTKANVEFTTMERYQQEITQIVANSGGTIVMGDLPRAAQKQDDAWQSDYSGKERSEQEKQFRTSPHNVGDDVSTAQGYAVAKAVSAPVQKAILQQCLKRFHHDEKDDAFTGAYTSLTRDRHGEIRAIVNKHKGSLSQFTPKKKAMDTWNLLLSELAAKVLSWKKAQLPGKMTSEEDPQTMANELERMKIT